MGIICPDCLALLETSDGKTARCSPQCGSRFQILFLRNSSEIKSETDKQADQKETSGQIGKCHKHSDVDAEYGCNRCSTPICSTCDFTFPGDIHLCPGCASEQSAEISPKRKKNLMWSFAIAGVSTLLFVLFFVTIISATSDAEAQGLSALFGILILISSVAGTSFGFSAIDKRLENPLSMWIATIWNLAILGIYLLLCIVGLFIG